MPHGARLPATVLSVFLLMLAILVHADAGTTALAQASKSTPDAGAQKRAPAKDTKGAGKPASTTAKAVPEVRRSLDSLPVPVLEMREAILAAVKSGRIEEIRVPIEMNEIKPNFGDGPVPDPVAHLKATSADGEGREVLAALAALLDAPYAVVPLGRDLENNRIYVWPHFAETGVDKLDAEQQAELKRLVPEPVAADMLAKGGRYTWWRVAIAADGTWHVFSK